MMHKVTREELERIDTMTALEAVAYANPESVIKFHSCIPTAFISGYYTLRDTSQRLIMREIAFWYSYMVLLYVALSGFFNAIFSLFAFGLAVFLFIQQQRFESRQRSDERTEIDD